MVRYKLKKLFYFSQVKRQNPERSCFLEYDKLYVDHRPFVWNEVGYFKNHQLQYQCFSHTLLTLIHQVLGQVVEASQVEKFNPYESLFSRPGTQMGMAGYAPYGMIPSRPPSGMVHIRPAKILWLSLIHI